MAVEVIVGTAVLHGIQNDGSAITIGGFASFILDRIEAQHMFDKYKTKDALGFDVSGTAFNERLELTIDFTPSGATRAAAAVIPSFPIPFSSMTLSHCKIGAVSGGTFVSSSAKIFDGAYLYEGDARIAQVNSTAVKISGMKFTKYADATQNTSMTTTVSG